MAKKDFTKAFLLLSTIVIMLAACISKKARYSHYTREKEYVFTEKSWLCDLDIGVDYLDCFNYTDSSATKFGFGKISFLFTKAGLFQEGVLLVGKDDFEYVELNYGNWRISNDTISMEHYPGLFLKSKLLVIDSNHIRLISAD